MDSQFNDGRVNRPQGSNPPPIPSHGSDRHITPKIDFTDPFVLKVLGYVLGQFVSKRAPMLRDFQAADPSYFAALIQTWNEIGGADGKLRQANSALTALTMNHEAINYLERIGVQNQFFVESRLHNYPVVLPHESSYLGRYVNKIESENLEIRFAYSAARLFASGDSYGFNPKTGILYVPHLSVVLANTPLFDVLGLVAMGMCSIRSYAERMDRASTPLQTSFTVVRGRLPDSAPNEIRPMITLADLDGAAACVQMITTSLKELHLLPALPKKMLELTIQGQRYVTASRAREAVLLFRAALEDTLKENDIVQSSQVVPLDPSFGVNKDGMGSAVKVTWRPTRPSLMGLFSASRYPNGPEEVEILFPLSAREKHAIAGQGEGATAIKDQKIAKEVRNNIVRVCHDKLNQIQNTLESV